MDNFAEGDLNDVMPTGSSSEQDRQNDNSENSQKGDSQGPCLSDGPKSNCVSSDDRMSYTGSGILSGKKFQLFVGNLTWWTTDDDIANSIQSIGVSDLLDVKLFENRTNGQSKGFCGISIGSESSSRTIMEELPKKEIHGMNPVVTDTSKQALLHFESIRFRRDMMGPGGPGGPRMPPPRMPPGTDCPSGPNRPPHVPPHTHAHDPGRPPQSPPPAADAPALAASRPATPASSS